MPAPTAISRQLRRGSIHHLPTFYLIFVCTTPPKACYYPSLPIHNPSIWRFYTPPYPKQVCDFEVTVPNHTVPEHLGLTYNQCSGSARWTSKRSKCRENVRYRPSRVQLDQNPSTIPNTPQERGSVSRADHEADQRILARLHRPMLRPPGNTAHRWRLPSLNHRRPLEPTRIKPYQNLHQARLQSTSGRTKQST